MKSFLSSLLGKFKKEQIIGDIGPSETTGFRLLLVYVSGALMFIFLFLTFFWSSEPDIFEVADKAGYRTSTNGEQLIVGYTTVKTTERLVETLLNKSGGFLSNDVIPPSVFLDDMPAWEYGALVQVRDMVSALRNHMSRSQSQSLENEFLKEAEPLFNNSHTRWLVPSAEGKYQGGLEMLTAYREAISQTDNPNAQFYARADNLGAWLLLVEKRLGGLSQRLSASVGEARVNTDLSGDDAAKQSTSTSSHVLVKTPWMDIDDNFYEARGACWALIHLLKAVEVDFASVLEKKNARASLAQIIRELEATQQTVWSPMILNGSGFGFVSNHSLVMASYVSRANAGLIDLRELLSKG
ncbi:MAG: DUF2333 family protein [Gammaproteobacteria bacterium]|nr:DUF2333 family protein [Gammaproteobacteria bacterium]MDH5630509.1 DUF2333 family protein [Gammaproteobacteria bacterium]